MKLVEKVHKAGVVGAGGAGFPTHIKLESSADLVIANGVECEPLLWSDKISMDLFTREIVRGLQLVVENTGAKEAIIAIKDYAVGQRDAFEKMLKKERLPVQIIGLPNFYPSGDEHVLVNFLTSKIIEEKGIPLKEGVLVNNVNTLRNVYLANIDVPVTRVLVTLNGEVNNRGVYYVPLGIRIKDFLEATDNNVTDGLSVLEGGPVTGRLVSDLDKPITKISTGIMVLPSINPAIAARKSSSQRSYNIGVICNQCRRCTDYCPRYLLGHEIYPNEAMSFINFGIVNEKVLKSAVLCCDCGICDVFACEMGLSPRKYLKGMLEQAEGNLGKRLEFSKPLKVRGFIQERRIPQSRLVAKLGILKYTGSLEFVKKDFSPSIVVLELLQGFGSPAVPVVRKGEGIKVGQLVAEGREKFSTNLHSSIDGQVKQIDNEAIYIEA